MFATAKTTRGAAMSILEATPENTEGVELLEVSMSDNEVSYPKSIAVCTAAWTGWYRHPQGDVYAICKDSDGYLVYKPGGGNDAWGTGYTWTQVKAGYGLAGITAYQSRCGGTCR